ncbi:MAG: MBL fold metallo-hydrolase [Pseudomonadota bacterium]
MGLGRRFLQSISRWGLSALAVSLGSIVPLQLAHATGCFPIAALEPRIVPASFQSAAIPENATVQMRYLGHSTYEIETREGARAVTDYNGYYASESVPHIATMNNAHSSHYTDMPDPAIEHVLRGWNPGGGLAEHDVTYRDLRVRNIPTSVHGREGAQGNSNSMFVFEVEDLCIAHAGHLHHLLTNIHMGELGIIDILMVPIDGVWTMSQENMADVIDQIRPSVVMPMHYFSQGVLARFLAIMEDRGWNVAVSEEPTAAFSRLSLPTRTVLILPIS